MTFPRTLLLFACSFVPFTAITPAAELVITPSVVPVSNYPYGSPISTAQDAPSAKHWALRPRWHGSHEEMLQFGDECLRTGRFDTCVPYYYLMVVDDISSEERDHKAIYQRPEINRSLRLAIDRYLETPDMPLSLTYAHTTAAILDYKSGNMSGARTHMAAIQFQPDLKVGAGLLEDLPGMMTAISAR